MSTLTYHIDKELSIQTNKLVIVLTEAKKESFVYKFLPPLDHPSEKKLRQLAPTTDTLILNWLIAEEVTYQKQLTGRIPTSFQAIHIPYSHSFEALKQLAGTGRLFFNQKQLVVDLYSKVDLFYVVASEVNGKISVKGRLKSNTEEFDLTACDFICAGPPHWFIKGITLQTIQTDIAWSQLKQAFYQPTTLSVADLTEEGASLVFLGNAKELLNQSSEPTPIFILKDRSGAFGDLWMDYGNNQRIAFHDPANSIGKIKRQRTVETAWEKDLLETDFIRKEVGTSHYFCPLDKVSKSLSFLLEIGWQIIDWQSKRVIKQSTSSLSLQDSQGAILIKGKVIYDTFSADISEVIGAFNRRERFVQLGVGTVGLLPQNVDATFKQLAEEGEIVSDSIRLKRNHFGILADLIGSSPNTVTVDPTLMQLRKQLDSFKGIKNVSPSADFKGELRPYQQEGVNWLAFLYEFGFHGILADDMGLGKTVQVLAFLSQLPADGPILIVLPTSLLFNWQREITHFLPECAVYLHHGPLRYQDSTLLPKSGIILTSYTTLRLDLPLLSRLHFHCLILDEAQVIKNFQTQVAQSACALQARFRLTLTGTPIENHLNELWSHFRFLMPDLLGTEEEFANSLQAANSDARYLQRIKQKIRPFMLRRRKEEVAKDLPECIEQVVWVEMGSGQRRIYDDFLAGVQGNLFKKVTVDGISKHRMEIFEAILRLRQICCHPLLVASQVEETTVHQSAKLEALLQDIETAIEEGSKILVYSQFTSMLALIAKAVKQRAWQYVYLDGSTTDRAGVVTEFQENKEIPLFLVSLKAGGSGLNLTAADYVFLYDPWWNEAVEQQAISRAHRIGRKETVIAKRYVAIETIEEKIMKLKAAKRSLIADVLDGDQNSIGSLSADDFRFLIS